MVVINSIELDWIKNFGGFKIVFLKVLMYDIYCGVNIVKFVSVVKESIVFLLEK